MEPVCQSRADPASRSRCRRLIGSRQANSPTHTQQRRRTRQANYSRGRTSTARESITVPRAGRFPVSRYRCTLPQARTTTAACIHAAACGAAGPPPPGIPALRPYADRHTYRACIDCATAAPKRRVRAIYCTVLPPESGICGQVRISIHDPSYRAQAHAAVHARRHTAVSPSPDACVPPAHPLLRVYSGVRVIRLDLDRHPITLTSTMPNCHAIKALHDELSAESAS